MRKLFLVRHGEAAAGGEIPNPPLSEDGAEAVRKIAVFLARGRIGVARIIHSDKTRARETARLIVNAIGPDPSVEEAASGLAPNDSTALLMEAIGQWTDNVMLVGHLPYLGRLASLLVVGAEDKPIVTFEPATVVALDLMDDGRWGIDWVLKPRMLGA